MGLGKAMSFEQEQCAELDSYYLSWIAEKEQIYATVLLSGTFYTGLANSFPLPRKYLHGKVTDTSEKTCDLSSDLIYWHFLSFQAFCMALPGCSVPSGSAEPEVFLPLLSTLVPPQLYNKPMDSCSKCTAWVWI